jgi:hypothetical protein
MVQTEFHYVCNEITKFNNVPKAKTQPWAKKCINDSDHQGISLKNEPTNQTNIDKAMTTPKKKASHTHFPVFSAGLRPNQHAGCNIRNHLAIILRLPLFL